MSGLTKTVTISVASEATKITIAKSAETIKVGETFYLEDFVSKGEGFTRNMTKTASPNRA